MPTDTDLAAANLALGTFSPVQLYSGEKAPVTTSYAMVNAAALAKYQVVALDSAGKVKPWAPMTYTVRGTTFATGVLTFSGTGAATNTITLNGTVITMMASGAAGNQFNVGASATLSAQAFRTLVNTNTATYGVTAAGAAAAITLTRNITGTVGNAYTTTEAGADASFGEATLTGGADEREPERPIGIAMQAANNAADGISMPVLTEAVLNPAALVWPAVSENYAGTLGSRIAAFRGTGIVIRALK